MAGDILGKSGSIVTLQNADGASLTNLSGGYATTADLDSRASGNIDGYTRGRFELTCQWATVTGITVNKVVAEVYLVPEADGTNKPDVDVTAGSSAFPAGAWFSNFTATKAPTASTNARFITAEKRIPQELMTAAIRNVSGQTIAANWSLKFLPSAHRWT